MRASLAGRARARGLPGRLLEAALRADHVLLHDDIVGGMAVALRGGFGLRLDLDDIALGDGFGFGLVGRVIFARRFVGGGVLRPVLALVAVGR